MNIGCSFLSDVYFDRYVTDFRNFSFNIYWIRIFRWSYVVIKNYVNKSGEEDFSEHNDG